jgi:putative nucleotidyltransferase with HDIG domain
MQGQPDSSEAWLRRLTALASGDPLAILQAIDGGATYAHGLRVAGLAVIMARRVGVPVDQAFAAGLFHDLGKVAVPRSLLEKEGPLDATERAVVELHSGEGERLLASLGLGHIAVGVREHHERLDCTGYPYGTGGGRLSLLGQLLAVADAYDTMTHQRPYAPTLSRDQALDALRASMGRHFSGEVVECLEGAVQEAVSAEPLIALAAALAEAHRSTGGT